MRSVFGLGLLLTGLSVGAYAYYPQSLDREVRLANVTRILSPAGQDVRHINDAAAQPGSKLFTPGQPVSALARERAPERVTGLSSAAWPLAAAERVTAQAPSADESVKTAVVPKTVLVPQSSWTTVVHVNPRYDYGNAYPTADHYAGPNNRFKLIRTLQQRLRAAGCYYGDIDGDWGPASRRAMQSFTRKVNASLPVERPDFVLLALMDAHTAVGCNTNCPAGHAPALDGTCRPNSTIIAGTSKPIAPRKKPSIAGLYAPEQTASITTASINPSDRPTSALVAPKPSLAQRPRTDIQRTGRAYIETAAINRPRAPLPGRMTIGAPLPGDMDARQPVGSVSVLPDTTVVTRDQPDPAAEARRKALRAAAKRARKASAPQSASAKRKSSVRNKSKRRYRKANRQHRLMRQAFGDTGY